MRHASLAPLLIFALAASVRSQSIPTVAVRGSVLDAGTSAAIPGALLTLTGATPAVLPTAGGPSAVLNASRVATTDSIGSYEIRGVTAGSYRLFVRRLGYQPTTIDLEVGDASRDTRLSFGLVVVPIRLEPVQVDAERLNTFGRLTLPAEGEDSLPVIAVRARQSAFLSSDVRDLTAPGSLLAGGTGEIDILRALRRFPGVTGKDDHSAELWVRGARWDQVRLSYDGLPIFNPLHASETMTAISGDAVGAAFLHPGVRPASLMSQGASLIDIRSRAATDTGRNWIGGASRRDISGAYESARSDGKSGWVVTGRRSYDKVVGLPFSPPRDHDVVGQYTELTLRGDRRLGQSRSVEFSALRTEEFSFVSQFGSFPGFGMLPVSSMGRVYRLTLNQMSDRLIFSQTAGFSGYSNRDVSSPYPIGVADTSTFPYTSTGRAYSSHAASVSYMTLRGELKPVGSNRWNLGYEFYRFSTSSFALQHDVSWSNLSDDHFNLKRTRLIGALWAEGRWSPISRLTLETGARLESPKGTFEPRIAPSVQGRLRLDAVTHLSAGASRTFQDAQEVPFTSARSSATRGYWFLSGAGFPAMRADQASLGIDRWLGASVLFDVNAFARRLDDIAVRPLPSGDSLPQPLVLGSQVEAKGLEFGLRKLAGALTGSLGYTLSRSTERIDGVTYDASGDRRHEVDASAMLRAGRYRFGSALTLMSGAPYTPLTVGRGIYFAQDSIAWSSLSRSESRNSRRLPSFMSLDLFAERTGRIRGKTVTPYIGVQNVLNSLNFTEAWARSDWTPDQATEQFITTRGRHANFGFRIVF
jgi:hypothetical protein